MSLKKLTIRGIIMYLPILLMTAFFTYIIIDLILR